MVNAEMQLQPLAAFRVPVRVEAAHEIDGAADRAPGPVAEIRAHEGRAALDLDFVLTNVVAEQRGRACVCLADAHEQVHERGLASAIRPDQRADGPARHVQRDGPKRGGQPEALAHLVDADCVFAHTASLCRAPGETVAFSSSRRTCCSSLSDMPPSLPARTPAAMPSRAATRLAARMRS